MQEQRVGDFVHWVLLHPDYASVGYAVMEYVFHLGTATRPNHRLMELWQERGVWEVGEKILQAHLGCHNRVEMVQVILGRILSLLGQAKQTRHTIYDAPTNVVHNAEKRPYNTMAATTTMLLGPR
jgi:hypothetical protein